MGWARFFMKLRGPILHILLREGGNTASYLNQTTMHQYVEFLLMMYMITTAQSQADNESIDNNLYTTTRKNL